MSSLTPRLNLAPIFSLLLLLIIVTLLLCYLNHVKTYKKLYLTLIENSFLLNLVVLTAGNYTSERVRVDRQPYFVYQILQNYSLELDSH